MPVRVSFRLHINDHNHLSLGPARLAFIGSKTQAFYDYVHRWYRQTEDNSSGNEAMTDKNVIWDQHPLQPASQTIDKYHREGYVTVAVKGEDNAASCLLNVEERCRSDNKDAGIKAVQITSILTLNRLHHIMDGRKVEEDKVVMTKPPPGVVFMSDPYWLVNKDRVRDITYHNFTADNCNKLRQLSWGLNHLSNKQKCQLSDGLWLSTTINLN